MRIFHSSFSHFQDEQLKVWTQESLAWVSSHQLASLCQQRRVASILTGYIMLLLEPKQISDTTAHAGCCAWNDFIAGVMIELSHPDDKGQEKQGRTGHNYWLAVLELQLEKPSKNRIVFQAWLHSTPLQSLTWHRFNTHLTPWLNMRASAPRHQSALMVYAIIPDNS